MSCSENIAVGSKQRAIYKKHTDKNLTKINSTIGVLDNKNTSGL
jgi:hypothetical protein